MAKTPKLKARYPHQRIVKGALQTRVKVKEYNEAFELIDVRFEWRNSQGNTVETIRIGFVN